MPPVNGDAVEMESGATMVTAKAFVTVALALSATCAVKLNVPVAVGVPLRTPALLSDRPVGTVPDATLHA